MAPKTGPTAPLFSEERQRIICNALATNVSVHAAANLAGVNDTTIRDWIRRGRDGKEPYVGFVAEVDKAVAFAQAKLVNKLNEASDAGSERATMFLLERRHRADWGRQDRVEHHHDMSPVVIELAWPGTNIKDPASEIQRVAPLQIEDAEVVDDARAEG
jgi:transposase-like protein